MVADNKTINIQNIVERINNFSHLVALKKAIVQLLPMFIALSFLVWANHYIANDLLKYVLTLIFELYPILLIGSYGYHYASKKQLSPTIILSFDIILMVGSNIIFNNTINQIWQITLPLVLLSFILNESIYYINKLPPLKSPLPQTVNDYLHQIMVILLFFVVLALFYLLSYYLLPYLIPLFNTLLQTINSLWGILIVILITVMFWVTGTHGVAFIGTILRPFWLQMIIVNSILYLNGQPPLFIGSESFYQWFIWIGGSGATLGLVLLMRFIATSEHLKTLGKDALVTGIVNINEQIIFGTPIVSNKKMRIPFIITPCLFAIISYYAITQGYIPAPSLLAPWIFPFILGSFMSTGGSFSVILFTVGMVIVSMLIYLPFFISYDRQLKKSERLEGET